MPSVLLACSALAAAALTLGPAQVPGEAGRPASTEPTAAEPNVPRQEDSASTGSASASSASASSASASSASNAEAGTESTSTDASGVGSAQLSASASGAPKSDGSDAPKQPVAEALRVEPGASCLEVERLTAVIVTYLQTTDVDARVVVEVVGDPQDPDKIRYTVRRRGEVIALRNFEAEATDCEQLHAVVGVSVALAIDATLVLPAEPKPQHTPLSPEPAPRPRGEDSERAPQLDARPSRATASEPSPWGVAVVGGGGVSLDAPPRLGGLGQLAVELQWKDYVDLSIGVLGSRSRPLPLGSGEATFALVGARADLCGGFAAGIVRSRGCAGLIAGGALARGEGFGQNETSRLPWVGALVGLDLRIRASPRVAVEIGCDGLAHILRPAFDFLDEDGARRLGREFPNFGGWATVGLVLKLR